VDEMLMTFSVYNAPGGAVLPRRHPAVEGVRWF